MHINLIEGVLGHLPGVPSNFNHMPEPVYVSGNDEEGDDEYVDDDGTPYDARDSADLYSASPFTSRRGSSKLREDVWNRRPEEALHVPPRPAPPDMRHLAGISSATGIHQSFQTTYIEPKQPAESDVTRASARITNSEHMRELPVHELIIVFDMLTTPNLAEVIMGMSGMDMEHYPSTRLSNYLTLATNPKGVGEPSTAHIYGQIPVLSLVGYYPSPSP